MTRIQCRFLDMSPIAKFRSHTCTAGAVAHLGRHFSLAWIEMPYSCVEVPECLICPGNMHTISSSRLAADFMQLPKGGNVSTLLGVLPHMEMLGGG